VAVFLRERFSPEVLRRKLRLFGCACARRIWPFLTDERARLMVGVAEAWADGQVTEKEFRSVSQMAQGASLLVWMDEEAWATASPYDQAVDYAYKAITYLGEELLSAPYETAFFVPMVTSSLVTDEQCGARANDEEELAQMG